MSNRRGIRGRPTWVSGSKFIFLDQYVEDWQRATDTGPGGASIFYTKVTKRFIKKYGWFFDRWSDKDCPDLDPATIDDEDSQHGLSNEEIEKRHTYYSEMRVVSINNFYERVIMILITPRPMTTVHHGLVPLSLFKGRL